MIINPRVTFSQMGLAAIVLALAGCAGTGLMSEELESGSAMPSGMPANSAPAGFISFCLRNFDQCASPLGEPATFHLGDEAWALLRQTNSMVNRTIRPEEDIDHYGVAEYWTIPTDDRGDCDYYAVTKRMELIKAGLPARALRLAIAIIPDEDRHVVLTVATDKGDYVLDNLTDKILPWNRTGYVWVTRQDPADAWGWIAFQTPDRILPKANAAARVQIPRALDTR